VHVALDALSEVLCSEVETRLTLVEAELDDFVFTCFPVVFDINNQRDFPANIFEETVKVDNTCHLERDMVVAEAVGVSATTGNLFVVMPLFKLLLLAFSIVKVLKL
jgi:hypothetical protein